MYVWILLLGDCITVGVLYKASILPKAFRNGYNIRVTKLGEYTSLLQIGSPLYCGSSSSRVTECLQQ